MYDTQALAARQNDRQNPICCRSNPSLLSHRHKADHPDFLSDTAGYSHKAGHRPFLRTSYETGYRTVLTLAYSLLSSHRASHSPHNHRQHSRVRVFYLHSANHGTEPHEGIHVPAQISTLPDSDGSED